MTRHEYYNELHRIRYLKRLASNPFALVQFMTQALTGIYKAQMMMIVSQCLPIGLKKGGQSIALNEDGTRTYTDIPDREVTKEEHEKFETERALSIADFSINYAVGLVTIWTGIFGKTEITGLTFKNVVISKLKDCLIAVINKKGLP